MPRNSASRSSPSLAVGQPRVEPFRGLAGRDGRRRDLLLGRDVVDAHEGGRVADVAVRLLVLLGQHFEDARVAPDGLVRALGHQIDDARRPLLPVAVHAAVALLEDHQRPRQVEVDEPVALVVQVDALRRHVRADQQAQRAGRVAEVVHHPLLVHVAQAAVEHRDLIRAETQVGGEPFAQPRQRFDALGEDRQPVRRVVRAPGGRPAAADVRQQRLVLGVLARADRRQRPAEDMQRLDLGRHRRRPRVPRRAIDRRADARRLPGPFAARFRRRGRRPFPAAEALVDAGDAGGGSGEQRLLQRDDEQVAARRRAVRRRAQPRHPHGEQRLVGRLLGGRGGEPAADDLPVAEGVPHLLADVLLEAADDEALAAEVVLRVVVGVGDGGGVQHVHQAGEAARPAVVRRRRQHDQRVGAAREQPGEAAAQRRPPVRAAGAPVGDVVRLVDDDDVPVRLLQIRAVLGVLLQGVDGDDGLVVVVERVVAGRYAAAHALDADRVEPRERDGEAVPELLLELRQHALDGQHQDAPAPAAREQLADEDARLQRLAQPDGVRDEDALPGLGEGLAGRGELVGHRVHRRPVGDVDALVVGNRLPELALQVEQAVGEAGRRVGREPRVGRVQHADVRLQAGEEDGFALADQLRDAVADQPVAAVRRAVDQADDPLGVADDDAGARRGGGPRRAADGPGRHPLAAGPRVSRPPPRRRGPVRAVRRVWVAPRCETSPDRNRAHSTPAGPSPGSRGLYSRREWGR